MKPTKYLTPALHLAAIFLITVAGGCSQEQPEEPFPDEDIVVTFNIKTPLPDMSTRALIDDNETPTMLQWSVYEVETYDNKNVVSRELLGNYTDSLAFAGSSTSDPKATLSMTLAKGRKYQVAFFAKNSKNTAVTYADSVMKIDYHDTFALSNNCSAYTALSDVLQKDGKSEFIVTLKRQMAMVGWFCADLNASSFSKDDEVRKITYTLKYNSPLFSSYNLLTQKFGDEVENLEYANRPLFNGTALVDNNKEKFSGIDFYYVCYNFILTDAATANKTLDMELKFSHPDIEDYNITVTSNSIPVRQNYKTRIFGRFLTNNEVFGITMQRDFDDDNNQTPAL